MRFFYLLLLASMVMPGIAQSSSFKDLELPHVSLVQLVDQEGRPVAQAMTWQFRHALVDVEPVDLARGLWRLRASHPAFNVTLYATGYARLNRNFFLRWMRKRPFPLCYSVGACLKW